MASICALKESINNTTIDRNQFRSLDRITKRVNLQSLMNIQEQYFKPIEKIEGLAKEIDDKLKESPELLRKMKKQKLEHFSDDAFHKMVLDHLMGEDEK